MTNLNKALQSYSTAVGAGDIAAQIALQPSIRFNGGGHINHSLFWQNLAPVSSADAKPDAAPALMAHISNTWGSYDKFKSAFSAALLALQGSGWGWLVKESQGGLRIVTTKDQDPLVGGEVPVFGVDMWEHAYYLQVCQPGCFSRSMSSDPLSRCAQLWTYSLTFAREPVVSQWQGCLRREYLERHQLESG